MVVGAGVPRSGGRSSRGVRPAVAAAVAAATLDAVDQALAEVAVTLAGQLDKLGRTPAKETPADRARRTADVVRVSRELRGMLRDLPLRAEPGTEPDAGGGDDDSDDAPAAGGDAIDDELAGIVRSGAEVGDPAHA